MAVCSHGTLFLIIIVTSIPSLPSITSLSEQLNLSGNSARVKKNNLRISQRPSLVLSHSFSRISREREATEEESSSGLGVGSSCRHITPSGQSTAISPVEILKAFEELLVVPGIHASVDARARPYGEMLLRRKGSRLLLGVALLRGASFDRLLRRGRRRVKVRGLGVREVGRSGVGKRRGRR